MLQTKPSYLKRIVFFALAVLLVLTIYSFIKSSIPYEDKMITRIVSVDSVQTIGPVVRIYEKRSGDYFWFKSYTTFNMKALDSLEGKVVTIDFMKVFPAPLENRIFKMQLDSVVIFDQVQY